MALVITILRDSAAEAKADIVNVLHKEKQQQAIHMLAAIR
jgi:hypothetical protein